MKISADAILKDLTPWLMLLGCPLNVGKISLTPFMFTNGKGVTTDAVTGKLTGVSAGIGDSIASASKGIQNNKVGVSTFGAIELAGGKVVNDHGNHVNISGITAKEAETLFKNVVKNPNN